MPGQGTASWLPWILKPCWGAAEQGCSCPAQSLHCPWSRSSEQSSRVGSAWPRAICQSLHRLALPPSLAGCWRGLLGTAVPAGLRHGHSSQHTMGQGHRVTATISTSQHRLPPPPQGSHRNSPCREQGLKLCAPVTGNSHIIPNKEPAIIMESQNSLGETGP